MWEQIKRGFNSLFHREDEQRNTIPEFEHWDNREGRPTATPTATPKPQQITPDQVEAGLRKFDASSPLLEHTQDLAEAANRMPEKADRWLPVVMAIMETGGGKKLAAENNPYNLRGSQGGKTKFIDYPDMRVAILGGDNGGIKAKGFVGTINEHPAYENYRKTGDPAEFFKSFTPPGEEYGNPSLDELLARYNSIKQLFTETQQVTQPRRPANAKVQEIERRARQY